MDGMEARNWRRTRASSRSVQELARYVLGERFDRDEDAGHDRASAATEKIGAASVPGAMVRLS